MAVTLSQLGAAIRLRPSSQALSEDESDALQRLQVVADLEVSRYAPSAPEAIRDQAVIQMVAYLYYSPPSGGRQLYANALSQSAAAALLDQYRDTDFLVAGESDVPQAQAQAAPDSLEVAAAIEAAIDAHNALSAAHRDLIFPNLSLDDVKQPLEAAAGNARLRASAVRDLATEIDAELGSPNWRDSNQPGQAGLVASQVNTQIERHTGQSGPDDTFAVDRIPADELDERWVRFYAALPAAIVAGRIIVAAGVMYQGIAFSGARNVRITIGTQDDDVGYAIALGSDPAYGELISPAGITIDQLAYSGDDQAILLRLRSGDDPGATIEVDHSTLGRYTLRKEVGAGATTRRNAYVIADNYYQYSIAAISDPFALTGTSGEQDFSVDPAGTISYWRPLSLGGGGSGSGGSGRPTPLVTDSTLDGTGIAGSALSVTNPFTAADEAKLDAIPNQDAANANMLYGFDGSGNYEVTGKDWLNSDDVDTRVALILSDAVPQAPAASAAAGDGTKASRDNHVHPEQDITGGGGDAYTDADADARVDAGVPEWTKQSEKGGTIPLSLMVAALQYLAKVFRGGGYRPNPNAIVQISQIKNTPYTAAQFTAIIEPAWGNTGVRPAGGGTEIGPNAYGALRIRKAEFPDDAPETLPRGYGLRSSPDEPLVGFPILTRLATADTATYYAYSVSYGIQPADDDLVLELLEAPILGLLPADYTLGVMQLLGMQAAVPGDIPAVAAGGGFRPVTPGGFREIHSGSTGVTTPNLTGNSPLVAYALDQTIDLDTIGDGIILTEDHLTIVTGPAALSFSPTSVVKSIDVRGMLSFQQVGFASVYNGTTQLGAVILSMPLYIGAVRVGTFFRRISKDAANELAGNVRYDGVSSGSNVQPASISDQTKTFILTTAAALLPRGAVGHVYVDEDTLPPAEGYLDNDIIDIRTGANRGHWVKSSSTSQGAADTGWAGKILSAAPQGNFQPVDQVAAGTTFRHNRWAAAPYLDPRGSGAMIPAGGRDPGVPGLAYYDISYVQPGFTQGQIDIAYNAPDRTYDGNFELRTQGSVSHDVLIPDVNARLWRLTGVSPATVSAILNNDFSMSEVDHVDTITTHSWTLIANTVSEVITQSAYDDLTVKRPGVLYLITGS